MTPTVENIWNEVASRLRSFIRSRVRDHATAEDILQEVFVKIHQKLPSLRAHDRLEAWVWRIARNAIADHFRRLRPGEPLPETLALTSETPSDQPDLTPCVRQFVNHLQPGYRDALLLTEWQGLSQEEMGKTLGLSSSGAKSRVQRARNQLKKLLLDCCRLELDRRGNVLEMVLPAPAHEVPRVLAQTRPQPSSNWRIVLRLTEIRAIGFAGIKKRPSFPKAAANLIQLFAD